MRAEIEEAVQLLKDGSDASVEQALALLQDTVFSFSMRVCGHREDAEDTMQEVPLKSVPLGANLRWNLDSLGCCRFFPEKIEIENYAYKIVLFVWMFAGIVFVLIIGFKLNMFSHRK